MENVLKPKNIPFPLGPSTFKSSKFSDQFRGGKLSEQRYPLVSNLPVQSKKQEKVLSTSDWNHIQSLLQDPSKTDNNDEKAERLREMSEDLMKSWGHKEVLTAPQIEAARKQVKFEQAKAEEREIEILDAQKLEDAMDYVRKAKEMIRKRRESFAKIDSARLFSEVLAENEKNIELKKSLETCRKQQDEAEVKCIHEAWNGYEKMLTNREFQIKARDAEIQKFQQTQIAEKLERLRLVNEKAVKFREENGVLSEMYQAHENKLLRERKDYFKNLKSQQDQVVRDKKVKQKCLDDLDMAELAKARMQQLEFEKKNEIYARQFEQRLLEMGKRQREAQEWMKKNIIPQQKKNEQFKEIQLGKVLKFEQDRENERLTKVKNHQEVRMENQRKDFQDSERRKFQSRVMLEQEKMKDRQKDEQDLFDHLQRFRKSLEHKQAKRDLLTGFWDKQVDVLNSMRKAKVDDANDRRESKFLQEMAEDAEVEAYADKVQTEQSLKGKPILPVQKAKQSLALGKGAMIKASDSSGIRIYREKVNPGEQKSIEECRERMSLNWQ